MSLEELLKKHPSTWTDDDVAMVDAYETKRIDEILSNAEHERLYSAGIRAGHSIAMVYVLEHVKAMLG